jgi:signal transduction histidine kinase/PAS domain-containing protein
VRAGTDAEVLRLRAVLRDLVALSAIPAAWIGREPPVVATGLADALAGLLQLDFAFVRLSDPGGAGAVEVTRGSAWKGFPEWLEHQLATSVQFPRTEIVPETGSGSEPCRGVAIPIGVNGEWGVVVAACERGDFPTAMDQLLLSLAANQASTAFQSARTIHERRKAEEELREARNELEVKVAERTAELRRSEAYLADAQRLTHTGSFAVKVSTEEQTHSSDEHSRMFGFDPKQGIPSLEEFFQRVHPEDRARCSEALARGIREATNFELEYRVVLPRSPVKYIRAIAHPVFNASGALDEFVGTVVDVTERKRAEEERRAQLWFFESMDGINRAIQGTSDLEQMLGAVLDVVMAIFNCDRAWLVHPGDPDVDSHRVRMERTQPEYIGAFGLGAEIPNDPEVAEVVRTVLASSSPVRFDPESGHPLPSETAERFSIRSMLAMAVHPNMDQPYIFGLHQCSRARIWTSPEERLFQEIGRRLADALNTLLVFRDLRESERKLERSRAELAASRARIVTAADKARRRIERDLHDGVQQHLVAVQLELRAIEAAMPAADERKSKLAHAANGLANASEELVEISRGIHPAILAVGGLGPALETLARRSPVPVELDLRTTTRLPAPVEVAAYYVVSEALTNAAKHADASAMQVAVEVHDGVLELSIRDDGRGGADARHGSGLVGLADRVDALGGNMDVASPIGEGTRLHVTLPIEAP